MEPAELVASLQPLITTLDELADTVDANSRLLIERDAERAKELSRRVAEAQEAEKRQAKRSRWTLIIVALVLALVCLQTYNSFVGRSILREVQSVTGRRAQDRQAVGTAALLQANSEEADCRSRRQQARLPAPEKPPPVPPAISAADLGRFLAPYSCRAQTPIEIYPGVKGEPAKGP